MNLPSIKSLVEGFEQCTLPKQQWTHEAHFVMALWYCYHLPLPTAVEAIRTGIKKYNRSVGGVNDADHGYHETITLNYIQLITRFLITSTIEELNDLEVLNKKMLVQPFIARDYLLHFYSKEVLMSREARAKWVIPDKR